MVVRRRISSDDVLDCLTGLFVKHGTPQHIRSDNGPEFTAKSVRNWLEKIGVTTGGRSAPHNSISLSLLGFH